MSSFWKTGSICVVAASLTMVAAVSVQAEEEKDIVTTAVSAGSFTTLATALQAADLVTTLKGEGPFTVFAPTDAAFAKLPKGTVESLLKPENKQTLTGILTYHVVADSVAAQDVVQLSEAKTVNGQSVAIHVTDGKVQINDSNVITTDIHCTNGIIHVIDAVLLPNQDQEKELSSQDAMRMIEHAVSNGVALYNSGDHVGCTEMYKQTAHKLVGHAGTAMPPLAMTELTHALSSIEHTSCHSSQAWTLRRGLDQAYYHLCSAAQ